MSFLLKYTDMLKGIRVNSLLKNSIYLMLTNFVGLILGFVFWNRVNWGREIKS